MVQYNMLDAKTNFSKLIKSLETNEEDVILIARNGETVAQITPYKKKKRSILGAGKQIHPDIDIDLMDEVLFDKEELIDLFDKEKDLF